MLSPLLLVLLLSFVGFVRMLSLGLVILCFFFSSSTYLSLSFSFSLSLSLTAEFGFYLVGGLWGPLPAARSLLVESKNLHTPGETKGGALSSRTPVV